MFKYKYFINRLKYQILVVPEYKDGGPGAYAFGSFEYDPQKHDGETDFDSYKADLQADLELSLETLPADIHFPNYSLSILPWESSTPIVTPATEPVIKDPIEPDIPVPVSGEIRAVAKGLTEEEE